MTSFLDDKQTQSFHQNGYVIVKNFFNDEETKLLQNASKLDPGRNKTSTKCFQIRSSY